MKKTLPKTREGFERPNHNDYATSSELKERNFSGTRKNSITDCMEIWILGNLEASVPVKDIEGFRKVYESVFGIDSVVMENDLPSPSSIKH